jgi:hypothetical protein
MKFVLGSIQPKPLNDIKNALSVDFKKHKAESQCITELKEIKQKVIEPIWEFDQRFKILADHLIFQIPDKQHKEWFIAALLPHIRILLMQQKVTSQAKALDISIN